MTLIHKSNHLNGLTSIRFFLAIWVVLYHNCEEFSNFSSYFNIINKGHVAVSGFFLLSGLVLAYNYSKKNNFKGYLQNRFARIYPLYFFSLLLSFPLFAYFQFKTNTDFGSTIIEVSIASTLMIQSWNYSWLLHLNPPTWSLSVEAFLYLIFPLFLYLFQGCKIHILILIQVIIYTSLALALSIFFKVNYQQTPKPFMHATTFILGLITGLLIAKNEITFIRLKNSLNSSLFFALTIVVFLTFTSLNIFDANILDLGILAPFYILIFLLLAYNDNLLCSKILVRLGEISYAIYLLHQPFRAYLSHFFRYINFDNYYLEFVIYLVLLISLSNFVYIYLELPLHRKLRYKYD